MMDEVDVFYEKLMKEEFYSKNDSKWEKMRYVAVLTPSFPLFDCPLKISGIVKFLK